MLARLALQHVGYVMDDQSLTTILKLAPPVRLRTLLQCITYNEFSPPLNRYEAKLALHVALSGGLRTSEASQVQNALVDTMRWTKQEMVPARQSQGPSSRYDSPRGYRSTHQEPRYQTAKDHDPELAVAVYRWYLHCMRQVPLPKKEDWMQDGLTPQSVRETAIHALDRKFRSTLEGLGWQFARVERRPHPHLTIDQFVVEQQKGAITQVLIHHDRGTRGETLGDGTEVLVPTHQFTDRQPLFRKGQTIGWRYEMHPVAPPSGTTLHKHKGLGF